ncbi:MAG: HAMP domain-containing histidine kinase [Clostridia bacterium]|nr:HAMP domain-containing histidine kinase [Clostridia bacterium]
MRKSKILKTISYILIPFLILIIGLSIFYEFGKEVYGEEIDTSTYFKTDTFLNMYMSELSSEAQRLIYHNDSFNSLNDGDITICFVESNSFHVLKNKQYNLKDYYFLITYNDLAITNVELTSKTNNLQAIKEFINSSSNKKANIINGVVESNSEIFANKALQYYEGFENTYYSIDENSYVIKNDHSTETLITPNGNFEYSPYDYKYEITDEGTFITEVEENEFVKNALSQPEKEWYTTNIKDFQIFSTYSEELVEIENLYYLKTLIKDLKLFEKYMVYAIPIASSLLIIIFIYLIIAIGHTNGKDKIDFNDLDKIPIEIVLLVGCLLVIGVVAIAISPLYNIKQSNYVFANSLLLTGYFISYILCAVMGITIIKRIKAKTLIKESLTGKICKWSFNLCKKILNKIKNIIKRIIRTIKELISNWPDSIKACICFIIYVLLSILLIFALEFIGFLIILIVSGILLYGILEEINSYKKIEKHLKEMYEGTNREKLNEKDFTKNFKEVVKYINDISRGYENAIEEGIKSERLKTELITNVSHDIKTPLTSIINYVDLIKKENIENEKIKEYVEVLDNKSQRLKKLTEDLVDASKASSGNVKLNIEKINVVELIKQTTGEFEDNFKKKELEIISEFAYDELYINADNRYMYRIVENLFSNISKYAQEKSRVYIDVKRIGSKARIDIKNISKERLNISSDELMQRFVRGDKSRTTEGSGLGLSISKSLTELQKGSFEIKIDGDLFKVELEFDII